MMMMDMKGKAVAMFHGIFIAISSSSSVLSGSWNFLLLFNLFVTGFYSDINNTQLPIALVSLSGSDSAVIQYTYKRAKEEKKSIRIYLHGKQLCADCQNDMGA